MTDKQANRIMAIVFWVIALAVIVGCCAGCAYTLIHKKDIYDTHENLRIYRAHVVPTEQPEKVNKLGDLIEETLEEWKGDYDAGSEEP